MTLNVVDLDDGDDVIGQEKISVSVWRELILAVLNWIKEEKEEKLGEPLVPPQPLDIGFLLTLTHTQHQAWEAFLVGSVSRAHRFSLFIKTP